MLLDPTAQGCRSRRGGAPLALVLGTLCALVALAALLPAGAPAGQSSQATTAPFSQLGAGLYHSCALVDDGTLPAPPGRPVRCWGFSGDGQLGYGNRLVVGDDETPATAGPVDLGAGRTAKALALGDYHSCAVLDNGDVRCWGYGNEGQLGLNSRAQIGDNETPGSVGPISLGGHAATAITAGGNHTCAILDSGDVRCWGLGSSYQLGLGDTNSIGDTELPDAVPVVNLGAGHTAKAITAGLAHTCAILEDDTVRCWGLGSNGQLGYADTTAVQSPANVGPVNLGLGRTAKAITAGAAHTCAILDDGTVRCWGLSDQGQLGYGNKLSIGDGEPPSAAGPVDLGLGRTAVAISAGGDHTCAVLDNGSVRCWGSGLYGQLGNLSVQPVGDNETPGSVAPVELGTGRTAKAIASGIYHTCARLDDASVRCWGNGLNGRLGICTLSGDIGDDETPASVGAVDIGFGGQACPAAPPPIIVTTPPPPPPPAVTPPPPPAPAATQSTAAALRAQRLRAAALRSCRAAVNRQARSDRRRALALYPRRSRQRALAVRRAASRSARGKVRCLRRYARTPGRVTTLTARARSGGRVVLNFRATGTDGANAPAARGYVVKQSLRPIRTSADFRRAPALCNGTCSFDVTELDARLTLEVTQLRRRTTYYYAIAARDNVSRRTGPRSAAVRVMTR